MSMVNQKCNSIHWKTTMDLLKFYSPKDCDDPFGSLLTRVAFGSSDRSDFCGVCSLEIMSVRSCDGSLLARVVSIVPDCADFLPIMWFSLGHSADPSTTASMVLDICTSQASLYVWSPSISGLDTHIASLEEILVHDKLFEQISWLILRLELMFIYGSLPRPPDFMVRLCFLTLLSRVTARTLDVVDCDELRRYLTNRNALRKGEIRLEGFKQLLEFRIDGCMPLELICEAIIKMMMTSQGLREKDYHIFDMSNGCTTEVLMQIFKSNDEDVVQTSLNKAASALYYMKLQLKFYGRFGTSTEIIYGSLPRPPEDLYI